MYTHVYTYIYIYTHVCMNATYATYMRRGLQQRPRLAEAGALDEQPPGLRAAGLAHLFLEERAE